MDGMLGQVGAASVKESFRLHGRGLVLVLHDQTGTVPRNGTAWSGSASASYHGPEFADAVDGSAYVTIILDERSFEALGVVKRITFSS